MIRWLHCKGQRAFFMACLLLCVTQGCFLPYVIQLAANQSELLGGAKPVSDVLKEDEISAAQRQKLELVQKIRAFAKDELSFKESENYTTINLDWTRKLYNVSASKPLKFEAYTWYYPIVGFMPYKGFFDLEDAKAEQKFLQGWGYDTLISGVSGYSTLGYFKDPLWPQMLEQSDGALAELILHELAHATLYFKNQSAFNESFATFAGTEGALAFLAREFGTDSPAVLDLKRYYRDEEIYGDWARGVKAALEQIYSSDLTPEQKLIQKKEAIDKATVQFAELPFSSNAFSHAKAPQINNAFLLMFERYNQAQNWFAQLLSKCSGNWREFIENLRQLEGTDDPFVALEEKLSQMGTQP